MLVKTGSTPWLLQVSGVQDLGQDAMNHTHRVKCEWLNT